MASQWIQIKIQTPMNYSDWLSNCFFSVTSCSLALAPCFIQFLQPVKFFPTVGALHVLAFHLNALPLLFVHPSSPVGLS